MKKNDDYNQKKEELDDEPNEDELGEYDSMIDQVRWWEERMLDYQANLSEEERAEIIRTKIEPLRERAREIIRHRGELEEKLEDLPEESASTWLLEQRQAQAEHRFRHELAFGSVGLTNEMISDLADDYMHIVEDSVSDEFRELRKELRAEMQFLNRYEREKLLNAMLEEGRIDEAQYRFLWSEFR